MKNVISRIAPLAIGFFLIIGSTIPAQAAFPAKYHPGHYMLAYFTLANPNPEFDRIKNEPLFLGVQRRYPWKRLEPSRGVYDFSAIEADLNYLRSMPTPKRLIIEITDNGRDESPARASHLPTYVLTPEFEGGVFIPAFGTQLLAKRWNTAVQDRQIALFNALGARFDREPFVEGIVLDETANGNLAGDEAARANYTAEKGFAGQKRIMSGLKAAFPNTMCIQYINFFSGANGPDGASKLAGFMKHAFDIGMGVGGPDVHVGGVEPVYPLYAQYAGSMPLAPAVQSEDYRNPNPQTGRTPTVPEILDFANRTLHVTHLSWEQSEPYFTNEVIPLVRRAGAPTGSVLPPASTPAPVVASAPPAPTPTITTTTTTSNNSPSTQLNDFLARNGGSLSPNPASSGTGTSNSSSTQLSDFLARNGGAVRSQPVTRLQLNRRSVRSSSSNQLNDLLARNRATNSRQSNLGPASNWLSDLLARINNGK